MVTTLPETSASLIPEPGVSLATSIASSRSRGRLAARRVGGEARARRGDEAADRLADRGDAAIELAVGARLPPAPGREERRRGGGTAPERSCRGDAGSRRRRIRACSRSAPNARPEIASTVKRIRSACRSIVVPRPRGAAPARTAAARSPGPATGSRRAGGAGRTPAITILRWRRQASPSASKTPPVRPSSRPIAASRLVRRKPCRAIAQQRADRGVIGDDDEVAPAERETEHRRRSGAPTLRPARGRCGCRTEAGCRAAASRPAPAGRRSRAARAPPRRRPSPAARVQRRSRRTVALVPVALGVGCARLRRACFGDPRHPVPSFSAWPRPSGASGGRARAPSRASSRCCACRARPCPWPARSRP